MNRIAALLPAFRAQFPEFAPADYPDSVVTMWLECARGIHRLSEKATLFLTAHLVALDAEERAGGAAGVDGGGNEYEEEQIGPKRVRYRKQSADERDTFYTRTSYGRLFLQLERRTPAHAMAVRVYG